MYLSILATLVSLLWTLPTVQETRPAPAPKSLADAVTRLNGVFKQFKLEVPITSVETRRLVGSFKPDKPEGPSNFTGNRLVAGYRTNRFMVHTILKDGSIVPQAHEEEGPNHDGIFIEVSVEEGAYSGPLVFPQVLERPYWKTYFDAPAIEGGKQYFHVLVSYGRNTNPELVKAVQGCFGRSQRR